MASSSREVRAGGWPVVRDRVSSRPGVDLDGKSFADGLGRGALADGAHGPASDAHVARACLDLDGGASANADVRVAVSTRGIGGSSYCSVAADPAPWTVARSSFGMLASRDDSVGRLACSHPFHAEHAFHWIARDCAGVVPLRRATVLVARCSTVAVIIYRASLVDRLVPVPGDVAVRRPVRVARIFGTDRLPDIPDSTWASERFPAR